MPNWLNGIIANARKYPLYAVFVGVGVLVTCWLMLTGGDPQVAQRQDEKDLFAAAPCRTTRRRARRWQRCNAT